MWFDPHAHTQLIFIRIDKLLKVSSSLLLSLFSHFLPCTLHLNATTFENIRQHLFVNDFFVNFVLCGIIFISRFLCYIPLVSPVKTNHRKDCFIEVQCGFILLHLISFSYSPPFLLSPSNWNSSLFLAEDGTTIVLFFQLFFDTFSFLHAHLSSSASSPPNSFCSLVSSPLLPLILCVVDYMY